jgi:predicted acyl esterase
MIFFPRIILCLVVSLSLAANRVVAADDKSADTNAVWLAEHYTKYEHRIPMRDGVRLFTRVYVPKDDAQTWPIMLTRTPYALKPYGADNYNDPSGTFAMLARDKFILVTQDVRGRYA